MSQITINYKKQVHYEQLSTYHNWPDLGRNQADVACVTQIPSIQSVEVSI